MQLRGDQAQNLHVGWPRPHCQDLQKIHLLQFCLFMKRIPNAGQQVTRERVASRCDGGTAGSVGIGVLFQLGPQCLVMLLHIRGAQQTFAG